MRVCFRTIWIESTMRSRASTASLWAALWSPSGVRSTEHSRERAGIIDYARQSESDSG